jgi:uncharacterized protein YjiS (DUF1127 family)
MKTTTRLLSAWTRWRTQRRLTRDVERLSHLDKRMLDDVGLPRCVALRADDCRLQRERRNTALLDAGGVLPW